MGAVISFPFVTFPLLSLSLYHLSASPTWKHIAPLAEDILHFCAFLQPDAIREELFQHDEGFTCDTMAFNKGMAALQRYSLMKYNDQEQTFSIHRLVQAVLIDGMPPDLRKQWRERVVRTLNVAFPQPLVPDLMVWARCKRLLLHVLVSATWTDDELTSTAEVVGLFHKAGLYLYLQFRYPDAEQLFARAVSIQEKCLGAEHPDIAGSLNMLAYLFSMQFKYERAELLYRRALRILGNHLGAEHPDTIIPLLGLANDWQRQGKYEPADALYQRALSILKQRLGPTHPHTQMVKELYATFLHERERYYEVAPLEYE